jgi:hypothetical protein
MISKVCAGGGNDFGPTQSFQQYGRTIVNEACFKGIATLESKDRLSISRRIGVLTPGRSAHFHVVNS